MEFVLRSILGDRPRALRDGLDLLRQRGEVEINKERTAGRPAIIVRRVAPAEVEGAA